MEQKEGIVLQTTPYRDNSKLVKILTDAGLETYMVKGSGQLASKNLAYTRELCLISFSYVSRAVNQFPILTTGVLNNNYTNIKNNAKALEYALYICELSLNLGEHVEDNALYFNFTKEILNDLNFELNNNLIDVLGYYPVIHALKSTYLLGIAPSFKSCVHCGSHKNIIGFSIELGGVSCVQCSHINDNYIDNDVYQILTFLYSTKMEFLTLETLASLPAKAMECFDVVQKYYERYLGFTSKVYITYQRLEKSKKH